MQSIWHGIKRSWHSTEGNSIVVGVERVSVTCRYPACTVKNEDENMRAMTKRKWMIQKENIRKCPNKIMMVGKEEVDYEYVYLLCFTLFYPGRQLTDGKSVHVVCTVNRF